MRSIYMGFFLVVLEELGIQDAMVCVVYDYHSLSILGPTTNCH